MWCSNQIKYTYKTQWLFQKQPGTVIINILHENTLM